MIVLGDVGPPVDSLRTIHGGPSVAKYNLCHFFNLDLGIWFALKLKFLVIAVQERLE